MGMVIVMRQYPYIIDICLCSNLEQVIVKVFMFYHD